MLKWACCPLFLYMDDQFFRKVEEVVQPLLAHLGFRLVEREFVNEMGRMVLRLYIDKEAGGVTIADCQQVSRAVGDSLDVSGVMTRRYVLEVSSPGVHRPLRFREDFERFAGHDIHLRTKYPIEGRSNYTGTLEGLVGDSITMIIEGKRYVIPYAALHKARVVGANAQTHGM